LSRSTLLSLVAVLGCCVLGLVAAAPPASAQAYEENFGKNKVQYRKFDWHIYHSPHFNIYYYGSEQDLLDKVASFAESAYDSLSRDFDFQIQEPTPLIYFATHSAFEQNNVELNFIPEGVGAFTTEARFRMVLPVDVPDPELMALIRHELTHVFQYHILFQGSLGRALASRPPTWFMEGMASYKAKDETTGDRMVLRDAVVNDQIPALTEDDPSGYFAYRIGHAAFDYIEATYGKEGFRDFLLEFRNTLGSKVGRAVKRAFNVDPEDFDADFRHWLRKKYLPKLLETGEPGDFGRKFKVEEGLRSIGVSPTASPSGDLVAAFSSERGDLDVSLFNAKSRRLLRNLTKGFTNDYQYLVGQWLTTGPQMGRDIAFSPDGNTLAVFAKRERGRSLVLIDVVKGGVRKIIDMPDVEQQLSPAWSPDGTKIAFSGAQKGQFDIFLVDLASEKVTPVTHDDLFDGAPVFTPDGQSLVFSSVLGDGYTKLFRVSLGEPEKRYQLTTGESNDTDAVFSPTGRRIYFTSDRSGTFNIHGLDLATGEIHQYTNAVTGCFMPTVLSQTDGTERLVYTALWKGTFDLYITDVDAPLGEPEQTSPPAEPMMAETLPRYEPDIQVPIDDSKKEKYRGFKLFLEGADTYIAVQANQALVGEVQLSFSSYLGDKRLIAQFESVDSLSNFDFVYLDLSKRWQKSLELFDERTFYTAIDQSRGELTRGRAAFQQTGTVASLIYPLDFYHRAEFGVGYLLRKFDQQVITPEGQLAVIPVKENFPLITAGLVGDSAIYANYGPIAGRRWRLSALYAPEVGSGGDGSGGGGSARTTLYSLDFRQYVPLTRRSQLAMRVFAAESGGSAPTPVYFGGLDTVRGFDLYSIVGDRGFFTNIELRFPLIDVLATPFLGFQGIRGSLFLDVGGAWYDSFGQGFRLWNGDENRLQDAVSTYGYGITVRFLGLDLNWDVAKQWDFKDSLSGFRTAFWIGTRF
jgi:Tol biopolymer transport system component